MGSSNGCRIKILKLNNIFQAASFQFVYQKKRMRIILTPNVYRGRILKQSIAAEKRIFWRQKPTFRPEKRQKSLIFWFKKVHFQCPNYFLGFGLSTTEHWQEKRKKRGVYGSLQVFTRKMNYFWHRHPSLLSLLSLKRNFLPCVVRAKFPANTVFGGFSELQKSSSETFRPSSCSIQSRDQVTFSLKVKMNSFFGLLYT